MERNRLLIWGGLIVACVLVAWYRGRVFWQPPAPPAPNVVFITGGSGPYWQITAAGAKAAAEQLGVNLTIEMPDVEEDIEKQIQIVGQLDLDKLDGVAISPLDANGQTRMLNRLADELVVVTFDSDAPLSERQCYVGTSNYGAGELSAALVREAIPDGGKVAVLHANLTKFNNIERKSGFEESISTAPSGVQGEQPSTYTVVGYFVDEGDRERSAQNIRDVLAEHTDLACLVGMNGFHGPILMDVLREEGKLGEVKLVAFDDFPETLKGIAEGHIYATVAQDPYQYGFAAIRVLKELTTAPQLIVLGHGTLNFSAEPVRQDNLESFKERLEQQRTEVKGESSQKEEAK